MQDGADLIKNERQRQIEEKGFTAAHDDQRVDGELALAAICYAAPRRVFIVEHGPREFRFVDPWPWRRANDRRPSPSGLGRTLEKRIELMIKAGALIAAEVDRLQRLKVRQILSHGREYGTCPECGAVTVLWHDGDIYIKCTGLVRNPSTGEEIECPYKVPLPEDARMCLIGSPGFLSGGLDERENP